MWGVTHNVNELLHFTLAFRPDFSHLQRNERTEFISLHGFGEGCR